jgi:hypothetical protein
MKRDVDAVDAAERRNSEANGDQDEPSTNSTQIAANA